MAKQVKIPDELHKSLSNQVSDTGIPLPIGAMAEEAIEAYLKRRKLNAMVMKLYRSQSVDEVRQIIKGEVAVFLGIPEEYLFD